MLVFNGDLDQATLQDVERIARIINMHDGGVLFVVLFAHDTGQLMQLVVMQLSEQGDLFEKIDIGQHTLHLPNIHIPSCLKVCRGHRKEETSSRLASMHTGCWGRHHLDCILPYISSLLLETTWTSRV